MARVATRIGLLTLATLCCAVTLATPAVAQAPPPQADLGGVTSAAPGEVILVKGTSWPVSTNVLVEVCGRQASNGDADCDRSRSRSTGIGADGLLSLSLEVSTPPTACPCVVRVTDLRSFHRVYLPLEIPGAPLAPLADPALRTAEGRQLRITDIQITDHHRVREWFGSAPRRTVTFSVENTGTQALPEIPVEVLSGAGDPDVSRATLMITDLAPGDERRTSVTITLDSLSMGSRTLRIEAGAVGWQFSAERQTSSFPWGLLAIGLLIVQVFVYWLRNRLRRRLFGDGHPTDEDGPEPGGGTSEAVIDLREPDVLIDLTDTPAVPSEQPPAEPARQSGARPSTASPRQVVEVPVTPDSAVAHLMASLTSSFEGVELPSDTDAVGFVELLVTDDTNDAPRPQRFVLSVDGAIGDHRWIELEDESLGRVMSVPVLPPDLLATAMVEAIIDRATPGVGSTDGGGDDPAALATRLFATGRSLTRAAELARHNLISQLRFEPRHRVAGWSVFLVLCAPVGERLQAVSVGIVEHAPSPTRTFTNVQFSSPVTTIPPPIRVSSAETGDSAWYAESWCSRSGRRVEYLHKLDAARSLADAVR